jgi:hypothetical protein
VWRGPEWQSVNAIVVVVIDGVLCDKLMRSNIVLEQALRWMMCKGATLMLLGRYSLIDFRSQ